MENIEDLLEISVFRGLAEENLRRFSGSVSLGVKHYSAGEFVAMQDSRCRGLYLLCSGRVRSYMTGSDGKQIIVEELDAPDVLAPAFVFATDNRFPVSIVTLAECRIRVVNREEMARFMHQEPVVMMNFLRLISDRSIFLSRKVNAFALQDLKGRLSVWLYENGEIRNQQQLADRLGVARPSLVRGLTELAKDGAVEFKQRKVVVTDREILRRYF